MATFSTLGNNPNPVKHRVEIVTMFLFKVFMILQGTAAFHWFIWSSEEPGIHIATNYVALVWAVSTATDHWFAVNKRLTKFKTTDMTHKFSLHPGKVGMSLSVVWHSQIVFFFLFPSTGCFFSQGVCKSGLTVDWQMRWQVWQNGAHHSGVINLLGALCL